MTTNQGTHHDGTGDEGILGSPAADRLAEHDHQAGQDALAGHQAPVDAGERRDAEQGMVLHEERVNVRTERVATERVRLRRRVITEERTVTVPVRREVIEVVNEPIEPGSPLGEGEFEAQPGEIEMIARSEVPVITTELVQIERVRLVRHTVTEQRQVATEVSREQADVEHLPLNGVRATDTTAGAPRA